LAGMVKDKMCALLHVQELLALLKKGVNIDGN
jgi:purine-binding chemotaxis protein CheW